MSGLVTIAQTDSTNDGSGASTTLEPPQVDNATDDAIIIKVTQSLNNSTDVANINVTTPTGYTLIRDIRDAELRSWVFWKRSTGSETIPTVTSDTVARWTCTTVIVTDVDWANGGVTQQVSNTAGGDHASPNLTTDSNGTASAIVCLYSLERRTCLGFRYPNSRAQTAFLGTVSTGGSEGIDNASAAGFDFITDRSTLWDGPYWEASGGGDSVAINVEVLVQGNIIPLQTSTYVTQTAPTNTFQNNMDWCREIVNSGEDLDGNTLSTWTFDASSDVDTVNDTITLTGHGIDESTVIYLSDGGNTAPTGTADDTFYYAFPQDANTIKLCTVNEDNDAVGDYYYNGTTQRSIVDITATGTGTITLTEARMINAGQSILDIFRAPDGNSANVGPQAGSYIGDAGYNQNFVGTSQRFNSVFDATNETISFQIQINSSGRLDRVLLTFIDEDGDWINWKLYQKPVSPNNTGHLDYQIQVDKDSVKSLKHYESGTFDHTRIRYLVITLRGNNASTGRWAAVNSIPSAVGLSGTFTAIGGQDASLTELVELAQAYTDSISKPSDLQFVSTVPIAIGDGINDVSFSDSAKSLAFPPLADGINTFQNYLASLGVTINATATSNVELTNSQIGASVPYSFDLTAASGSTVDLSGNSYVFANASLDSDIAYDRQLFVGGEGVKDNGAEIRNSTFITNSQVGAGNAMIDWSVSSDIESSSFQLEAGTTSGHGIKITTTGTHTFTGLSFSGFGADGSDTAAVYNDSGGAATIDVFSGQSMTVKDGVGASTTIRVLRTLTLTGLQSNSEVRVYQAGTTTEVAGVENSGASFSTDITESSVDIVIFNVGYVPVRLLAVDTSSNASLPIQQRIDRNYANP